MPPFMRSRTVSAKQIRVFFFLFLIRHAFGIALFAWILAAAREVGNYFWVIAAALAIYAVTAVYNGMKIWGHYQQRLVQEAQEPEAEAPQALQEVEP